MLDVTLYLLANPLVAIGVALLALLTIYNVLRGQARVAMGLWLTLVASLFYIWVQVAATAPAVDDSDLVAPPATSTDAAGAGETE